MRAWTRLTALKRELVLVRLNFEKARNACLVGWALSAVLPRAPRPVADLLLLISEEVIARELDVGVRMARHRIPSAMIGERLADKA